ncbi:hypothetical protein [Pseudomonas aeruginosa]|uniref:hypothetical protein n=1 Tax=Pseudomonas aeruginosa TaxID=287 RepID=UPI001F49C892|nr:hypothetical protein [Pseudomonas aeruginosa]
MPILAKNEDEATLMDLALCNIVLIMRCHSDISLRCAGLDAGARNQNRGGAAAGEKLYEADGFTSWIKKMRVMGAFLGLLFIPLSLVALLFGGFFGVVVPVGFVYVMWKLIVGFPKVLKDSFLRSQLASHGFSV